MPDPDLLAKYPQVSDPDPIIDSSTFSKCWAGPRRWAGMASESWAWKVGPNDGLNWPRKGGRKNIVSKVGLDRLGS